MPFQKIKKINKYIYIYKDALLEVGFISATSTFLVSWSNQKKGGVFLRPPLGPKVAQSRLKSP